MYKLFAMAMVSSTSGRHNASESSSPRYDADENAQSASLGKVLTECLDMLRIENAQIRKKAVEFVGSLSIGTVNAYGKWITAVKAIADACAVSNKLFSQSDMCDFLTVAAKGVDP